MVGQGLLDGDADSGWFGGDASPMWAAVGALLLAFAGAGAAAPPDPFTQLLYLPVLFAALFPVCLALVGRFPGADGGRPFLAFVGLGLVAGLVASATAGAATGHEGGAVPVVGFLAGVAITALAAARFFAE